MSSILIVKCKTKILSSIGMILFGIAACAVSGYFLYDSKSLWWIIGILFGVFCIVTWTNILRKGSMTLVFLIQGAYLFFTYETTKTVLEKLEEIKQLKFFSSQYELAKIQNFWRYIQKLNGSTNSDYLHFQYAGKEIYLADLGVNEVELNDQQLKDIAVFLLTHNPNITIGKP